MLTITNVGEDSVLYAGLFNHSDPYFPWVPWLIIPNNSSSRKMGLKPVTSEARNRFGDKDCEHMNIHGNVVYASDDLFAWGAETRFTWYAYPSKQATVAWRRPLLCGQMPAQKSMLQVVVWGIPYHWETPWYYENDLYRNRFIWTYDVEFESDSICLIRSSRKFIDRRGYRYDLYNFVWVEFEFDENSFPVRRRSATISFWSVPITPPFRPPWGAWSSVNVQQRVALKSDPVQINRVDLEETMSSFWKPQGVSVVSEVDHSQEKYRAGDLCQIAANNTRYLDVNTSMYAADFFKMASLLKPYLSLLKGEINPKVISNAYLAYHYGMRLTAKDTQHIAKAIRRFQRVVEELEFQVARSRTSVSIISTHPMHHVLGTRRYNFKLYYDCVDTGYKKALRELSTWDMLPSLANLWDFIPYSFVVDWFLGIQDNLERLEHKTTMLSLEIYSSIFSMKDEFIVPASSVLKTVLPNNMFIIGDVKMTRYTRTVLAKPPVPLLRASAPEPLDHWVEGLALLIQRR